eukprot:scaffold13320_cov118-Isochrysis_galbana.AAC.12
MLPPALSPSWPPSAFQPVHHLCPSFSVHSSTERPRWEAPRPFFALSFFALSFFVFSPFAAPRRAAHRNSPSPLNARVSWSALSRTSGSSSLALVSRTDGGSIGRRVSGDREKSRSRQSSRNSVRRRILVFGSAARAARHGGTCGRASTAAAASADARRRADTARHAFCRTAVVASGGSGLRSASSTRCACRARHAR